MAKAAHKGGKPKASQTKASKKNATMVLCFAEDEGMRLGCRIGDGPLEVLSLRDSRRFRKEFPAVYERLNEVEAELDEAGGGVATVTIWGAKPKAWLLDVVGVPDPRPPAVKDRHRTAERVAAAVEASEKPRKKPAKKSASKAPTKGIPAVQAALRAAGIKGSKDGVAHKALATKVFRASRSELELWLVDGSTKALRHAAEVELLRRSS